MNHERSGNYFNNQCSIHIDAPPDAVFDVVGRLDRSASWAGSSDLQEIWQVTEGEVSVGTMYRARLEMARARFETESKITGYVPGERITWESRPVGESELWNRWSFNLTPEDGGTRLRHQVQIPRKPGFGSLLQEGFMTLTRRRQGIARGMERTLANVKRLAEARSREG